MKFNWNNICFSVEQVMKVKSVAPRVRVYHSHAIIYSHESHVSKLTWEQGFRINYRHSKLKSTPERKKRVKGGLKIKIHLETTRTGP